MISLFLLALGIAAFYFAVVWAISTKVKNYGFLDVAWSYGVAVLAPIYAIFGPGEGLRKWVVTALGVAWSLRLGTYILRRVLRHHPEEDARYKSLRKEWPGAGMFLLFFELQAIIAVVFSWPFLAVAFDTSAQIALVTWFGIGVSALAIAGESLADHQSARFKADPANKGKICEEGLWRYSRHPNYFFEFLAWVGFFLCAVASPWGWIAIVCPVLILYFLLKVTGIELTEKHSIERHGEKYRQYQRTTSAFVPWFRKKA